jgi:hypothetical protein
VSPGTFRIESVGGNDAMLWALFVVGFGLVPTILETAVVIPFIWLMIRIGMLAYPYSAKLRAKLL